MFHVDRKELIMNYKTRKRIKEIILSWILLILTFLILKAI